MAEMEQQFVIIERFWYGFIIDTFFLFYFVFDRVFDDA